MFDKNNYETILYEKEQIKYKINKIQAEIYEIKKCIKEKLIKFYKEREKELSKRKTYKND